MSLRQQIGYQASQLTQRLSYPGHVAFWRWARIGRAISLERLTGLTHAGTPGTLLLAGAATQDDYVSGKFFAGAPQRETLGSVAPWVLPRRLRAERAGSNLTVALLDRAVGRLLPARDYVMSPEWNCVVIDTVPEVSALAVGNASLRHDLARKTREGFGCVASTDPAEHRSFFDDMVRPYIEGRHGNRHLSFAHMQHTLAHGALRWVVGGGERLAGLVVEVRGPRLFLRYFGVARGDPALMRRGVLAAAYFDAIEYAWKHGCRVVDFGGVRPWLGDGILRYKAKWGARFDPRWPTPAAAFLGWPDGDPHVAAMLRREALICRRGDAFSFVAAGGAWPPELVPVRPGEWPKGNAIAPAAQSSA